MKREEEIAKYCEDMGFPLGSCSSINSIKALTASDAIKWADKTMLEKVSTWLFENFYNNPHVDGIVSSCAFNDVDDMIDNFYKAME